MNPAPKSLEDAIRQQASSFINHRNTSFQNVGKQVISELLHFLDALHACLSPERQKERRPLLEAILQQENYRHIALDMLDSDEVVEAVGLSPKQMLWYAVAYNIYRYIEEWKAWSVTPLGGYAAGLPAQPPSQMSRLEYLVVVDAEVGVAKELVAILASTMPNGKFDFAHYQFLRS